MKADVNTTTYSTKDLYESAFLYASDLSLLEVQRDNRIVYFIFEDFDKCSQLKNDYWSYKAIIDPKKYSDAVRNLKDLIYAEQR